MIKTDELRILLVEDYPLNRRVLLAILERLGIPADWVANGVEAVKAVRARTYDLLLMDCEMPEMNGYEATRQIRNPGTGALNPHVPIVAVTAYAMPGHREQCLECGMDDYLNKPVRPETLAHTLAKHLNRPELETMIGSSTPASGGPNEAFDRAGLLKRLGGNERLAKLLINEFVKDAPEQLSILKNQMKEGDASGARRQAHKIKGAAAALSAEALRRVSLEAEQAATRSEWQHLANLLPLMETAFERFKSCCQL